MLNSNAQKWIKALRSGEFKQTKGTLTKVEDGGNAHCCLGVACQIYQEEVGGLKVELSRHADCLQYNGEACEYIGHLSVVKGWLGLQNSDGYYDEGSSLVAKNDSGKTFEEIADIIESEPQGLFKENQNAL